MRGYRLSLLRHGKTLANEKGIYIGKTDYPLSDEGISELENMYDQYDYPKVQRVYSSPLRRALMSAEILFPERQTVVCDGLREMDFGAFEGLSVDELIELESYKNWLKGGKDNPPPGGESLDELTERCYSALDAVILDMMRDGITHAGIITHSGIIMNMLSCFGIPKYNAMELSCGAGQGYEIITTAMMWQNGTFEILGKIPGQP